MKLLLSVSLMAILLSFSANAENYNQENDETQNLIILSQCNNFGTGVSYFYQTCVNNNFSNISRATQGYLQNCMNMGQEVDYFFTSCISNNFRSIQRQLGNSVYLQTCSNYDRKTLDYFFTSCVNNNFRTIERELNKTSN